MATGSDGVQERYGVDDRGESTRCAANDPVPTRGGVAGTANDPLAMSGGPGGTANLVRFGARRPPWRVAVGSVLRDWRTDQGLRLSDVAERARVSVQYLSEVERGRKEPSSEVLGAVTVALGSSLTDLALGVARQLTAADDRRRGARSLPARFAGARELHSATTTSASLVTERGEPGLAASHGETLLFAA